MRRTSAVALAVLAAALAIAPSSDAAVPERFCGTAKNGVGVVATTPSCRTARKVANRVATVPGSVRIAGYRWSCRFVKRGEPWFTRCVGRPGRVDLRP